jgi:ABC-type multidrug transport system ATPase subunit
MESVIEMTGVRRRFGSKEALDGLDLRIERGQVVGLLGPNGAGKTTTLRILRGLIRADAGVVRLIGQDPWTMEPGERRRIGYLSEADFPFPEQDLAAAASFTSRFHPRWDEAFLGELVERLGLPWNVRHRDLSRGEQRKFFLALTLAPRPEVLLLDDPGQGLDVATRREFVESIVPLLEAGETTIVFSSHVMSDIERLADRVAILDRGRLVIHESLDGLKERVRQVVGAGEEPPPCGRLLRTRRAGRETAWTMLDPDLGALERLRASGKPCEVRSLAFEDVFLDLIAAENDRKGERQRHGVA